MNASYKDRSNVSPFGAGNIVEQEFDVVVMGAGIGGLQAAVSAKRAHSKLRIALLTAGPDNGHGGCSWKTHGANAAMNPNDSVESHISDTLRGGGMIGNPELVEILCRNAPAAILEAEMSGILFDKTEDKFDPGFYGGSTTARSVHSRDMLGLSIVNRLWQEARCLGVEAFHFRQICQFVTDGHSFGGVIAVDLKTGRPEYFAAPVGVTAMGGGVCVYPIKTIASDKQATAAACFLEAGGAIVDAEMVQFHPTGLCLPNQPGHGEILEEELRSQGAKFRNSVDERFMFNYSELGEKATRDIVARGCYEEIRANRGSPNGGVWLDLSSLPKKFLEERFPFMLERCRTYVDLTAGKPIETSPAAHFWMGGIYIESNTETSIAGLFACGEDAGGIHGGNRLGGNGVTDALVFGKIAGQSAAEATTEKRGKYDPVHVKTNMVAFANTEEADRILGFVESTMWNNVGPVRDDQRLLQATAAMNTLQKWLKPETIEVPAYKLAAQHMEMRNVYQKCLLARLIVSAASERTNSVGAHFRRDSDMDNSIYNTRSVLEGNGSISVSRIYRDGSMSMALAPEDAA